VASGVGGAIANTGTASITRSTFTGNVATSGGAIANSGTITIINSTFTGNSSPQVTGVSTFAGGTIA